MAPPHGLQLSIFRSTRYVSTPLFASSSAVHAPAGPPPTTATFSGRSSFCPVLALHCKEPRLLRFPRSAPRGLLFPELTAPLCAIFLQGTSANAITRSNGRAHARTGSLHKSILSESHALMLLHRVDCYHRCLRLRSPVRGLRTEKPKTQSLMTGAILPQSNALFSAVCNDMLSSSESHSRDQCNALLPSICSSTTVCSSPRAIFTQTSSTVTCAMRTFDNSKRMCSRKKSHLLLFMKCHTKISLSLYDAACSLVSRRMCSGMWTDKTFQRHRYSSSPFSLARFHVVLTLSHHQLLP